MAEEVDITARDLLEGVRRKLSRLGIKLGPVLSPSALIEFETRHGVVLPEQFREFLLQVGNGGDGPGYGLNEFNLAAGIEGLSEPFPLVDVWNWDEDPYAEDVRIDACFRGWIKLGTEGSGMDWVLLVSGPERGQVWNVEGQGAQPCAPRRSFLEWYDLWLGWRMAQANAIEAGTWWDTVWSDYRSS